MERVDDVKVAVAAASGTLVLVGAGELLTAGGPLLKMLPLFVYFAFVPVHDPERGGFDRVRTWIGGVALVTLAALAWLAV
ncbi:MAG: hypothetical protein ABEJ74_00145 [Haloferacaceae archaeon]